MRPGQVAVPSGQLATDALYEYALRALARRSYTEAELESRIRRRSASGCAVQTVIKRLRRHGYLDDARVAEAHSTLRRDRNAIGPKRVLLELERRGIAEQTAETAVADTYDGRDEAEIARTHLRRKTGVMSGKVRVEGPRELARLYRSLVRAGFRRSAIAEALRTVTSGGEWVDALVLDDTAGDYGE